MSGDVFPSAYSTPHESPGFLLWQVANGWQRRMRAALKEVDLTHVQFVVLAGIAWLSQDGETPTQARLARHAKTDAMMTSQILRTLSTKGYIERGPSPLDRRAKNLTLTPEGRKVVARSIRLVEAADKGFFGVLERGPGDLASHLRRLLEADREETFKA